MDAVISGQAGRAILLDNGPLWLLDVNNPRRVVPINRRAVRLFIGGSDDLEFLENTKLDFVVSALRVRHNQACSLTLLLIALDSELSRQTRSDAICELEEFLHQELLGIGLENILYSKPVPEKADLPTAIELSYSQSSLKVREVLQKLSDSQHGIREVRLAWNSIPNEIFENNHNARAFENTVISQGLFRELAIARGSGPKIHEFRIAFLSNQEVRRLANHRDVLNRWVAPFLNQIIKDEPSLEDDDVIDTKLDRGRKPTRKSFDRAAQFEKTNRQKEAIVKAMQRRDNVRARNLIDGLVVHHELDGARFAVMSLCDLAIEAKVLGLYSLQLELTQKAIELQANDAWSWAQYGDALLRMERLKEAFRAYQQASELGAGPVATHGQALVLKQQGRLSEALASYDAIIADSPDAILRCGRAEVLKELGRLKEALDSYEAIIAQYPENVVARNGRAGVLRAMRRLDEALVSYDSIIAEYPNELVPRNGRAEVLKHQWRLNDALSSYNTIIAKFPENAFSRSGRAEVLKELGRFQDALDAYDAIIAEYPENVIARTSRAGVLAAMGRTKDGLVSYNEIIAEYPNNLVARNARAEVMKLQGALDEALASYDDIIAGSPEDVFSRSARAAVLKELGRFNEALVSYDDIISNYPEDVVAQTGRAGVLRAMGRLEESLTNYDDIVFHYPGHVHARVGRAQVLKDLGRFEEAVAYYDRIVADFPDNAIARHARSSVLLAMSRYEDAIASLPDDHLETHSDWIGYQLRGLVWLHMGESKLASIVFERGSRENPWKWEQQYFRTPLAFMKLSRGDFVGANTMLNEIVAPALQTPANILRLHSLGELSRYEQAKEVFNVLAPDLNGPYNEVIAELQARYVLREAPLHDNSWVSKHEVTLLPLLVDQALSQHLWSPN